MIDATEFSMPAMDVKLVTSALLAGHYLFYKTAAVDERRAEARSEELNLRSYDRGHIEDIKSRFE